MMTTRMHIRLSIIMDTHSLPNPQATYGMTLPTHAHWILTGCECMDMPCSRQNMLS